MEKQYQFNDGMSRAENFPSDAAFTMDPEFPDNTLLTDNLINLNMMIVVSSKLREFLEKRAPTHLEYLRVTILNHKGKPASEDYFIIHPIDPVDCLDLPKSQPTYSSMDRTNIKRVKQVALDESKVDRDRLLFRPKSFYRATLIKEEVAAEIDRAGFTGVRWVKPEEFTG
ncbi:MAG: DUF1629 domain-containing protein [Chthoniobacteraceae bacterium]